MRLKLLVATADSDYGGHLSGVVSDRYADLIDVNVCSTPERLTELLAEMKFDVALTDVPMIKDLDIQNIRLPLLLWADEEAGDEQTADLGKVSKYQRVSSIVADVLERFAKVTADISGPALKRAHITAVWSPAGGVGTTTVALAYAAKLASGGRQALYLNLEYFSSVPAYFARTGKSISSIFEMLEAGEGNVKMLIRGIRCQDNGVAYFNCPENFDDMNILSPENIAALLDACCETADELIVDMTCVCGERERQVFETADKVFIVTDPSDAAQAKLSQFVSQHNDFARIRAKTALVENKGATICRPPVDTVIPLPLVQSVNASEIYKTLSGYDFLENRL